MVNVRSQNRAHPVWRLASTAAVSEPKKTFSLPYVP